jgi:peptide/nickel transport system substrate-binding protein
MTRILHTSRRKFLGYAAALAGLAVLHPSLAVQASEPKRGGTVTLGLAAEPPTLSALGHTAYYTVFVSAKTNEGLLNYDFDLNPLPELATRWQVSDDGLEYTFGLRDGVKWHDGKPFTSADVAFSIATIREVHPRGRNTFLNLDRIETPDELTVRLVLTKPAPYLITALAASETPIVPKHIYEGTTPLENPAQNAPIGTGPFVFREWVRGSHIVYDRNPDYWDEGKPYIDQLVVRFIPDGAARAAAIETGEVQIAPGGPLALSELPRFEALENLGIEWNGYQYANGVTRVEFNLDRPIFKDVRVRRAVAHLVDRNVIRDVVNYGYPKTIPGPINPNLKRFYFDDIRTYEANPAEAERLLDEAGYKRGADGVRFSVFLDYVPGADHSKRGAEYIRQALAPAGINVEVRTQDFATYTKRVYTDRDFDFLYNGMSNLFDPTVGVQRLYWSKNFKPGVPFSNGSHYSNPKVDALFEASAEEIDPEKRSAQWREIQEILAEDVPSFYVIATAEFTVYDKRVAGHTVTGAGVFGNLADVHFVE